MLRRARAVTRASGPARAQFELPDRCRPPPCAHLLLLPPPPRRRCALPALRQRGVRLGGTSTTRPGARLRAPPRTPRVPRPCSLRCGSRGLRLASARAASMSRTRAGMDAVRSPPPRGRSSRRGRIRRRSCLTSAVRRWVGRAGATRRATTGSRRCVRLLRGPARQSLGDRAPPDIRRHGRRCMHVL